jgi:excinuclease UvrABC ATPase subunit
MQHTNYPSLSHQLSWAVENIKTQQYSNVKDLTAKLFASARQFFARLASASFEQPAKGFFSAHRRTVRCRCSSHGVIFLRVVGGQPSFRTHADKYVVGMRR